MPVIELDKPATIQNITLNAAFPEPMQMQRRKRRAGDDTHRIGSALSRVISIHRTGDLNYVNADTKNAILNQLNKPISQGNPQIDKLLGQFHSHLMSQVGRRKYADLNIITSVVRLAREDI